MALVMMGVPKCLARDGWRLEDAANAALGPAPSRGRRRAVWSLAGLLLLADVLFWDQSGPGLSLAVFGLALGLVAARERAGFTALTAGDGAAALRMAGP